MAEYEANVSRPFRISLIVTTYNSPEALRLVLASIKGQVVMPCEVIVADDGSSTVTRDLILKEQGIFPCRLIHSWQPDCAFRLSRSRNLAAMKASGNWFLFIDGDCLLPPNFIAVHQRLASSRHLVFGARKLLSQTTTTGLMEVAGVGQHLNKIFIGRKFWSLPLGLLRTFPRRSWRQFRGFLMGVDRDLFWKCAGFDESFRAWGLEDSDFAVRAVRAGGQLKDGRYANAVSHLYHPEPSNAMKSSNEQTFSCLLQDQCRFTPHSSIFLNN